MRTEKFVSKYKETITDMNSIYTRLLRAGMLKDCRAEYLREFEAALGLNCRTPLWQNPRYIRVSQLYPLPRTGYVSIEKFSLYMTLYEAIMRDNGLLDRESGEADGYDDLFWEGSK